MTTTVKVIPAGHRVKVTQILTTDDGKVPTETIIEPGGGERAFHAHSTMEIHVEEIPVERAAEKAPIGSLDRVTQDLESYKRGETTR